MRNRGFRDIFAVILIAVGLLLVLWFVIGQIFAQLSYDGQYISFRTIGDISVVGLVGVIPIGFGFYLLF